MNTSIKVKVFDLVILLKVDDFSMASSS